MGAPKDERMPPVDAPASSRPDVDQAESAAAISPGAEAVVQTLLVVHDAERAIAFYTQTCSAPARSGASCTGTASDTPCCGSVAPRSSCWTSFPRRALWDRSRLP